MANTMSKNHQLADEKPEKHHHHHHHIKNIFRKESTPESDSSHKSVTRLFHHDKDKNKDEKDDDSHKISRTPSILSLRRHNSLPHQSGNEDSGGKKLTKAETMAHIQHINQKNAAARAAAGPGGFRKNNNPETNYPTPGHAEKIKYNPFGINKTPTTQMPKNTSFYLNGGDTDGSRVLANPVANPNDFLPPELQQEHVNLLEDFEIDLSTKKLGDGGSSDVRIINLANHKRQFYALKKFVLLHKESDEDFYKRAIKEFIISKRGGESRHVVDTIAILRIQSQANMSRGWGFVLEFCGGGDLFNTIVKPGWKRSLLAERYCIFKQIAYGLKFLHEKDIVHKDLKPENVLIDANGIAKLCDFGVSDFGHETPGDFSSPVKLSTAYVGSPPYSPPEVMKLRELSSAELKNWAYDPFKMDHWGLGMLLFCIVYCGIPFHTAVPSDHAYRDYKFNRDRFCSDHPAFKKNDDYSRGPGSDFKWAAQFQSNGAARVAWKLCDPSVNSRYNLDQVFNDPWFVGLEMCIYEHEDQTVDPVVHTHSNPLSLANSRTPSKEGGFGHVTDEMSSSFRSMLDLNGDNESIKSALSLTNSQPRDKKSCGCCEPESSSSSKSLKMKSMVDEPKKRSMLDIAGESESLPAVKEHDENGEGIDLSSSSVVEMTARTTFVPESDRKECTCTCHKRERSASSVLKPKPLKANTMMQIDSNGMCDLGYKIKKHHHTDISNVAVAGSMSRRN